MLIEATDSRKTEIYSGVAWELTYGHLLAEIERLVNSSLVICSLYSNVGVSWGGKTA